MRSSFVFFVALALASGCTKDEPLETGSADADTDADSDSDTDTDVVDTDTAVVDTDTDTASTCVEDTYEPNDDFTDAIALTEGTDLAVCRGNSDVWSFDVPSLALVTATVTFVDADGDLDIRLYDEAEAEVEYSTGTTNSEDVTYLNESADTQTMYLEVYGYNDAENTYDLVVDVVPATDEVCADGDDNDHDGEEDCWDYDCAADVACACPAEDANEPNDDETHAKTGVTNATGLAVFNQDPDFFAYTVAVGDRITATVPFDDTLGADISVDLYADGVFQDSSYYANPQVVWWDNDGLAAADVVVAIVTSYSTCASYDLDVAIAPIPPEVCDDSVDNDDDGDIDCDDSACTDVAYCQCPVEDASEDNDTRQTASPGPVTGTFAVFGLDPDYLAYTIPPGGTITVDLTHNLGDVDLALLSDAGTSLRTSTGTDFDEHLTYTNAAPNPLPVVLEVDMYRGTCAAYTLTAIVSPPAP